MAHQGEPSEISLDEEESTDPVVGAGLINSSPNLPLLTRFLYAIGPLGVDTSHLVVGFFFTPFLLEVAKLDPYLSGFVFLAGQIVDGITTPLIGKLTDNTRSRWGRRRPWLMFGGLPFTLFYICLWHTWAQPLGQTAMFAYFLIIYACFSFIGNSIVVPLAALTPDLVDSYDHSTQLNEARTIIFAGVSIVSVVAHSYLIEAFPPIGNSTQPNAERGYSVSAVTLGVTFGLGAIACGIFLKERMYTRVEQEATLQKGFFNNLRDLLFTLKSRSFICVLLAYFLGWTAVQLLQNNLFLYVKYVIKKEPQFMFFVLGVLATTAPAAFFWSKVTVWAGKRNVMLYNAFQFSLVLFATFFLNPTTPAWIMYLIAVGGGISIGQYMVVPWSMIPDIIDEDERDRGIRREGAFYSIFVLFQKIGLATALSMTSWVLGMAGYVAPDDGSEAETQPPQVIFILRVIAGPVAASLVLISMVPLMFYNLDRLKVEEITDELQGRKTILQIKESEKDPLI